MNVEDRVKAYLRQAGVPVGKPYVLTAKQRRRIKQKDRRDEEGRRQQGHFNK